MAEMEGDAGLRRLSPLPAAVLAEIPADSAVLIAGPPLTGKYGLFLRYLTYHGDSTLVISTKHGFERVLRDLSAAAEDDSRRRTAIVDCVSYHHPPELPADDAVEVALTGSPANLSQIGVEFTARFDDLMADRAAGQVSVGLHALSQLLNHADVEQVYQFLQVLVGKVRTSGCSFSAVVDIADPDDGPGQTLQEQFDVLVHTRENDSGRREFRVRGLSPTVSEWTAF